MQALRTRKSRHPEGTRAVVRPGLMWFALLGGVGAWAFHLIFAWSLLELTCLRGNADRLTQLVTGVGLIGAPWLVAVAATVTAVVLRAKGRRADVDEIARGRLELLTLVAILTDLLMVATITGGGIALSLLDTCA